MFLLMRAFDFLCGPLFFFITLPLHNSSFELILHFLEKCFF